ncbi:MAG: D-alanyl-D-alanine carboxypeptidase, partial [Planctomycetota bacterium]
APPRGGVARHGPPRPAAALRRPAIPAHAAALSVGACAAAPPATLAEAVPDPAACAARVLRRELTARGIAVVDGPGARPDAVERIVAVEVSASLREWLTPTLLRSDNLCAEQIARLSARHALADGASAAMARHAAAALERLGVDPRGLVMADGSGLSRRNLAQPRQIVGALLAARAAPWRDDFLAALPTAGRSGTLAGRFRDGPAHGRVRA